MMVSMWDSTEMLKLSLARKNVHLAVENAQVVDDYLESEKRTVGSFPTSSSPSCSY